MRGFTAEWNAEQNGRFVEQKGKRDELRRVERKIGNLVFNAANARIKELKRLIGEAELEEIITKLERGSVPLEESIAIYERGEALKKHCDGLLRNAEMRIEKITLGADGGATGAETFDTD